jgi:hypothetical protein
MQGSYGLILLIKDLAFPDPSWQRKITIGGRTPWRLLQKG